MCRGSKTCTLLPSTVAELDSRCPLRPPAWFEESAWLFRDALNAARGGNQRAARVLLQATRSEELADFYIEHAQNAHRSRVPLIDHELGRPPRPQTSAASGAHEKDTLRLPTGAAERALYERDGYRCRYCGGPVIPKNVHHEMHALLPEQYPLGASNASRHGVRLALSAVPDHVVPYSTGGTSGQENLVTSCWPCNFGKASRTLDDLLMDDPRDFPPVHDEWDGAVRPRQ